VEVELHVRLDPKIKTYELDEEKMIKVMEMRRKIKC